MNRPEDCRICFHKMQHSFPKNSCPSLDPHMWNKLKSLLTSTSLTVHKRSTHRATLSLVKGSAVFPPASGRWSLIWAVRADSDVTVSCSVSGSCSGGAYAYTLTQAAHSSQQQAETMETGESRTTLSSVITLLFFPQFFSFSPKSAELGHSRRSLWFKLSLLVASEGRLSVGWGHSPKNVGDGSEFLPSLRWIIVVTWLMGLNYLYSSLFFFSNICEAVKWNQRHRCLALMSVVTEGFVLFDLDKLPLSTKMKGFSSGRKWLRKPF